MGNVHARQYGKMQDVQLLVHDRDPERLAEFSARWGATSTPNPEDLYSQCEMIDVCLPTDLHLPYALKAVSNGSAVFVEKPMARTLEECDQLIEAADKAKVPLSVGQVLRFFPEYELGHKLIESGAVGKPATARTRRGGAAPRGREDWFMRHERSGGVLLDLAIHDFDWLRWTLGEVDRVYARSVAALVGSGPDYALTTLSFDSGALGHVEATWMDPSGFRTKFEVAGSAGLIEWDSRREAAIRTHMDGANFLETPLSPTDDPYYRELRSFIDAANAGTAPPVSPQDARMAVSIALAALESAKTGREVRPVRT